MQLVDLGLEQFAVPGDVIVEHRDEVRYAVKVDIEAFRLDDDFHPVGTPLCLKARDISDTGIGFTSEFTIFEDYLLLRIPTEDDLVVVPARLIWEEKRCNEDYYRFGAKFLVERRFEIAWPE